jgi:ribosomal protein L37AE/L43A
MSDTAKADLKNRSSKRCPVCFSREMDVLLVRHEDGLWGCVKCAFLGTEAEIRGMYKDVQKKYHGMIDRYTLDDQRAM